MTLTQALVLYFGSGIMHQSIQAPTSPPRQPPEFCLYFQPGSLSIIKVPSCQLMPHEGTFKLETDLTSIAALLLQNLFGWEKTLKL